MMVILMMTCNDDLVTMIIIKVILIVTIWWWFWWWLYDDDFGDDYDILATQIQNPDKMSRATDPMRRKQQKMIKISWKTIHGIRNPGLSWNKSIKSKGIKPFSERNLRKSSPVVWTAKLNLHTLIMRTPHQEQPNNKKDYQQDW